MWRALFAVAVVSYVLCVLLLSGVQKDDLDAGTLRKLQRRNVNIDDIDGKIREQCFAERNAAMATQTQRVELQMEPIKSKANSTSTERSTDAEPSPAELEKIFEYLKQKEVKKELNMREITTETNIQNGTMIDLSKLPSSVQNRVIKEIIDSSTESPIIRIVKNKRKKQKSAHDYELDDDLQNIEKVHQENSTQQKVTDKPMIQKTNDFEYISKIVAQILAERPFYQQSTTTTTAPSTTAYFDGNKLAQDIHSLLEKSLINNYPPNLYLNNFNVSDEFERQGIETKKSKEESEVIDALLIQLRNRDKPKQSSLYMTDVENNKDGKQFITKNLVRGNTNGLFDRFSEISKPTNIVGSNRDQPDSQFLDKLQSAIASGKPKRFETSLELQQRGTTFNQGSDTNTIDIRKIITKSFPYLFGDKNNRQDRKTGIEIRCQIFNQPNDLCKSQNYNEFYQHNAYRSFWPYILESLSKGELKLQDMHKIPSIYWTPESKIKTNIDDELRSDNRYKSEWLFNGRSDEQIILQTKDNQNSANNPSNNDSIMNGKLKDAWPYYYDDSRLRRQYDTRTKSILVLPNEPAKSGFNQQLNVNEEEIVVKPRNRETSSDAVRELIISTNKDGPDIVKRYKNNELYATSGQSKEHIGKAKSIPPGVIKQIADSVKELVLRDLQKIMSTTNAATTISITTRTMTSTTVATAATSATTTTKPTTITTTEKSSTVKEDHLNIHEASKALEKFLEIFEKFKSIKDSIVIPENATNKDSTKSKLIKNTEVTNERDYPMYPSYISPYTWNQLKRLNPLILDPYMALSPPEPIKNLNTVTKKPQGYALTLQTNSVEIPPLNVAVSKPLSKHNTIIVTPVPRLRGPNLHRYSAETVRDRQSERHQVQRTKHQSGYNISKINYRDPSNFQYGIRTNSRTNKNERNYKDRAHKQRLHGVEKFHEKLERGDDWPRYGSDDNKCTASKENCNVPVASRRQRPLVNTGPAYDDTHFRNFLKTQQKVTDMLERILATDTKHIPRSAEIL